MDPDLQPNQSPEEQEVLSLEQQLAEAQSASNFFENPTGQLIVKLINKRVNLSLQKITSDKFEKDHMGYINELSWLNANKKLLRELQVAAHPLRKEKLQERIDNLQEND